MYVKKVILTNKSSFYQLISDFVEEFKANAVSC